MAVFAPEDRLTASILAKQDTLVVAGLPLLPAWSLSAWAQAPRLPC